MRKKVKVTMCGFGRNLNPICEESCYHQSECANHTTAGDFRSEGGFTPNLLLGDDGSWTCDKQETNSIGMLAWSRHQKRYMPCSGPYDEAFYGL